MLEKIVEELHQIGYSAKVVDFPNFGPSPQAVLIDILVPTGRYKGQELTIGISFQEEAYPEYPPHFVHLKSTIQTHFTRNGEHEFEGDEWYAYSWPPSDFWDSLDQSKKNMNYYFQRHLLRVFSQL